MTRFVRPAWLQVQATGRQSVTALGPSRETGYLRGDLTLRTSGGGVSRSIDIMAGQLGQQDVAMAALTIPSGFRTRVWFGGNMVEQLQGGSVYVEIEPVS